MGEVRGKGVESPKVQFEKHLQSKFIALIGIFIYTRIMALCLEAKGVLGAQYSEGYGQVLCSGLKKFKSLS